MTSGILFRKCNLHLGTAAAAIDQRYSNNQTPMSVVMIFGSRSTAIEAISVLGHWRNRAQHAGFTLRMPQPIQSHLTQRRIQGHLSQCRGDEQAAFHRTWPSHSTGTLPPIGCPSSIPELRASAFRPLCCSVSGKVASRRLVPNRHSKCFFDEAVPELHNRDTYKSLQAVRGRAEPKNACARSTQTGNRVENE
jgi:hypothetical protein